MTEIYRIGPGHLFSNFRRAWLFLIRAKCACGYRTRPYFTLTGATDALLQHQLETGTKVELDD